MARTNAQVRLVNQIMYALLAENEAAVLAYIRERYRVEEVFKPKPVETSA